MEPANVKRNALSTALVFCFLVALGISSRLIQDFVEAIPPNFHAVTAVALFAGFTFRRAATAACVPLVAMMMSDAVIGGHHPLVMAAVYASLAFPVAWRVWLRGSLTPWSVGAGALASSTIFYLATNLAHWYAFKPHTLESLARVYYVALPFFGYSLCGDLVYSAAIFGAYALMVQTATVPPLARALAR